MFVSNKNLLTPIQYIKGVGPRLSQLFSKKGVDTVIDALYYFPRAYEDRRELKSIADLVPDEKQVIKGFVLSVNELITRMSHKKVFIVTLSDNTSTISLKWFKAPPYIKKKFKPGLKLIASGVVTFYRGEMQITHPEIEFLGENEDLFDESQGNDFQKIVPLYSETEGLTQKIIRKVINKSIEDKLSLIEEFVPDYILESYNMLGIRDAIREVHQPGNSSDFKRLLECNSRGHLRLIFNEFFILELILGIKRRGVKTAPGLSFSFSGDLKEKLLKALPFSLTSAQERCCREIEDDLRSPEPMNRLIQGDVGSGKTLVAFAAALGVIEAGFQSVLMVPTEILASQHYENACELLKPLGVKVGLLVAGLKAPKKREVLKGIETGDINFVIGTHALIQEKVSFNNLGFAIIDEQHRFGVRQRHALMDKARDGHMTKNKDIDVLVMSATPIPRTLALTVYGDLDVSTIDEMPPGRIPVKTEVQYEASREKLYTLIRETASRGEQVYIVYPLVEESQVLDLKDATNMAEVLKNEVFPDLEIALIHGKMKQVEKDKVMERFKAGEVKILISTTVIEVGVNVPMATLMVVEHAERFGLSQLHQLRGRVGRSKLPSKCVLMTNFKRSEVADVRLDVMVRTTDGFKIAEEDLAIRGPGEFLGTRQSGLPGFKLANIIRDQRLLEFSKKISTEVLKEDPFLEKPQHNNLKKVVDIEMKRVFWG